MFMLDRPRLLRYMEGAREADGGRETDREIDKHIYHNVITLQPLPLGRISGIVEVPERQSRTKQ